MKLKIYMNILLAILVGCLYQGVGNDATKAIFNFGLCFTVVIAFMYNPMMPILLSCNLVQFFLKHLSNFFFAFTVPSEIELLKREHFNRWFRLGPYFWAMLLSKLPVHICIHLIYLIIVYVMSSQPLEFYRLIMFISATLLIGVTSESLGVLISSRLSLIVITLQIVEFFFNCLFIF